MKKRIAALVIGLVIMLGLCVGQAESDLIIHFIDVGQADAAVILCEGEALMIDGGNPEDSSLIYSYLTKTLGLNHIDYMLATHAHEDHIGGLSGALNACTVGKVYSPVANYDSKAFQSLIKYAKKQGVTLTVPSIGETFDVGSAKVTIMSPAYQYEDTNNTSIVAKIVYGDTSFLFTGDAGWDTEHDMVDLGQDLSATLLKVGHHGSDTSSSYLFLREVMPQYAVISVGEGNPYGHPTDDVLSRLDDVGATVYRTDLHGHIIVTSDGRTLSFSTQKNVEQKSTYNGRFTLWGWGVPVEDDLEENPSIWGGGGESPYIGNRNSKKLHYAECPSVDDMKEKNKIEFYSREEAMSQGYNPCGRCKP